jgi:hypothetical protein
MEPGRLRVWDFTDDYPTTGATAIT